ncbi:MAG: OmpA family protein, partial [candidate division Zixibacteria bacterium]|nr:OmpA family protein [candidate division Zixibacteria bacterium]
LLIIAAIFILMIPSALAGYDYLLAVGGGLGLATRNSGTPPWFSMGPQFHFNIDARLSKNWLLEVGYSGYKFSDNASTSSEFSLGSNEDDRTRKLNGYDLSVIFKRVWYPLGRNLGLSGGLGAGLSTWRISDPGTGITLSTSHERGGMTEFEASEMFLASVVGIDYQFKDEWKVGFNVHSNYMTGAGMEFEQAVEDSLGRWNLNAGISLSYLLGGEKSRARWDEIRQRPYTPRSKIIKSEKADVSTNTTEIVSIKTKNRDSDNDGIADEDDKCPNTQSDAKGYIDIHGCPIDSDADSYPDYRDNCPHNLRGAVVDRNGCPIDSDNDGVPDGLDDCPGTTEGAEIDKFGCPDLSFMKMPAILNIKYRANSFEIDPYSKKKLDSLVVILKQASIVQIEIVGYTDNNGTISDNKKLAKKRANRVRDYLVSVGLDPNRLTTVGRGAEKFIASNKTEQGRKDNRRVELVFSR